MSNISKLIKKLNLNVSEYDFESIFYHNYYLKQNFYLKYRNNAYAQLGKSVIDSVSAIFLYNNFKNFNAGQMSRGIVAFKNYVVENFYNDYKLDNLFVNPSDVKDNRTAIISKFAGFIYKKIGFTKIYEIFLPYLKNFNPLENTDYKTILQEYAQDMKKVPVYEILSTEGAEHKKIYKVQVIIGDKFAIGSTIGKKRATIEAAKNFIEKYKIDYQANALRGNKINTQNFSAKSPLTFQRKKLLTEAISKLKIEKFAINYRQMDEIFTHSSFLNEHKNENKNSNENLSIVGANILDMFCCDYIIENYNLENIVIAKTKSFLLDEENLFKFFPDSITNYLLTSRSHKKCTNEISRQRMKVDIFKSILAAMFLNYFSTSNDKFLNYAKKFAETAFSLSADKKLPDYTTFLQEVVQKFSFLREEKFFELKKSADNIATWKASLKIIGDNFSVSSESYSHNKNSARNLAAKEILPLLFPYCSNDLETKEQFSRIMNPEELFLFEMKKNNQQDEIFSKEIVQKNVLTINETFHKNEISFDNAENILYVRKGIVFCSKNNHKIFSVTGILNSLSGESVKINVNYCEDCKIFFIDYSEFKYYRDMYGILLGNYLIQENFNPTSGNYENLSAESVLKNCGYTVNQADNLTAEQRHLILSNLIDNEIISKPRIIKYLQFFINFSKYRDNMKIANQKWQDDLNWVRDYNIDTQKHFFINSIENF